MRQEGTIFSWNERGFAFIFLTHKQRFFMHISEWDNAIPPMPGDRVTFEIAPPRKEGQLSCAVNVRPVVETSAITPELVSAEKGDKGGVL